MESLVDLFFDVDFCLDFMPVFEKHLLANGTIGRRRARSLCVSEVKTRWKSKLLIYTRRKTMLYRLGSMAIVILVLSIAIGCGRAGSVPDMNLPETTIAVLPNNASTQIDKFNSQRTYTQTSNLEQKWNLVERSYWPTQTWQSSTPEEQGMDSQVLAEMLRQIQI